MKNNIQIVLNEGNGKVINKIFSQWNNIKTEKQYKLFSDKVKNVSFGTYGTIPFIEVLDKFTPQFPNEIIKTAFYNEMRTITTN